MSLQPIPHLRSPLTVSSLATNAFLSDVAVFEVDSLGQPIGCVGAPIEHLVQSVVESGSAEVTTRHDWLASDAAAAIAIPIHRDGQVVSVAALSAKQLSQANDDLVGVFEVWEPIGVYEEVALTSGYYGRMDRFHNVSSFVRFEKGSGLPGLVWQERCAVIHDDLGNHPGFLRAAGASADLLVTAIGIPVASTQFHGVAVLIGSRVSPLARGFEVWQVESDGFSLLGGAYRQLPTAYRRSPGSLLAADRGLPGLAAVRGGAVLCTDADVLLAGTSGENSEDEGSPLPPSVALAIPFFDGDSLTSVATLLF